MWVSVKYERLPIFCYFYGLLGHTEKDFAKCFEAQGGQSKASSQFGVWLRAAESAKPTKSQMGGGPLSRSDKGKDQSLGGSRLASRAGNRTHNKDDEVVVSIPFLEQRRDRISEEGVTNGSFDEGNSGLYSVAKSMLPIEQEFEFEYEKFMESDML